MGKIRFKGSTIDPNTVKFFKSFDEFYKWVDSLFEGDKKDFEELYFQYHDKPKSVK